SGVSFGMVGRLLLQSLPSIVVMTIPMSLLFGILIGVGRLSTDSELVALRASGISLFSLYRPILILSGALTLLNVYLMLDVVPQGNSALKRLQLQILAQSLTEEVEPRVPHTSWQNKVLYVFEAPPGERRWKGVFLSDVVAGQENELVVARWGEARAEGDSDRVTLKLEEAVTHNVSFSSPDTYRAASHDQITTRLATLSRQNFSSVKRGMRQMNLGQLRKEANSPDAQVRNTAQVEIHKRFSFPAACLVFGLLGLPLGFSNARGGRSSGFALSIGVILVYYILFNAGEDSARDGKVVPWLAVWFPNILMLFAGLFLLARKNRDKSLLLSGVDRWIQNHLWGRVRSLRIRHLERREERKRRSSSTFRSQSQGGSRVVLRFPELRLRFPNAIDRYILRAFLGVLGVATLSGLSVYLVADVTENLEDVLENKVAWQVVVDYYQYRAFSIIYEIAPIIVLATTLITFGLLSRTNEIVAVKAAGVSLYRIALPVVLASFLIALLAGYLQSEVLPAANGRAAELQAKIKGREPSQRLGRGTDRQWLYGKDNLLYNYSFYDPERRELRTLQIFKFDDQYRLIGRLMVDRATHIEGPWWVFSKGWARTFEGQELIGFSTFDEPLKYRVQEPPEYFEGGLTPPEEMSFVELRDYIHGLEAAGQNVPELHVALQNKLAYPAISLVMALVAMPFAFRLGRRGALYGIGLALVMGIVLFVVLGAFEALGENAILPPAVAIWSPSAIFAIFSLYLFLGVRS
ncbi:MAG: LptF/LptG family permease, partial [Acidobacteriota bacterium]